MQEKSLVVAGCMPEWERDRSRGGGAGVRGGEVGGWGVGGWGR